MEICHNFKKGKNVMSIEKVYEIDQNTMHVFNDVESTINNGIVLFGAGMQGIWNLEYLQKNGYKVDCFIDNSQALQDTFIENIPVFSYKKFKEKFLTNESKKPILVTANLSRKAMLASIEDYSLKMSFASWFFIKKKEQYEAIRSIFSDEKSKIVLDNITKAMLTGDFSYYEKIAEPNQYFSVAGFFCGYKEVFVDLGAFCCEDTERFIFSQSGNFSKAFAFEPSLRQCTAAKKRIERLNEEWAFEQDKLSLIQAGIGKEEGEMYLTLSSSSVTGNYLSNNNKENQYKVPIHCLDSFFTEQKITFIKADIEGFEFDMLLGAEKTIKRDKPKIAICVYHRPEDLITILELLKNFVPEYRFFLRHHSHHSSETVLYCMV